MRWLITLAWQQEGSLIYDYETTEIDEHPVEFLNRSHDHGRTVSLVFAMKLHPEDPELDQ